MKLMLMVMIISMIAIPSTVLADDNQFFIPTYGGDSEMYMNNMGDNQFQNFFAENVSFITESSVYTQGTYWNIASDIKKLSLINRSIQNYEFYITTSRYTIFKIITSMPISYEYYTATTKDNILSFKIDYDKLQSIHTENGYIKEFVCVYPADENEINKKCLDLYVEKEAPKSAIIDWQKYIVYAILFLIFVFSLKRITLIAKRKKNKSRRREEI